MSISVLAVEAVPATGATGAAGAAGADPRALVDGLTAPLDAAPVEGLEWRGLDDGQVLDVVAACRRLANRLAAVTLAGLAEADRRQAARRATGAVSTAGWLHAGGTGAGAARRQVELAQSLGAHPGTGAALGSGAITVEQAAVITTTVGALSDAVDDASRRQVEADLIAAAAAMDPARLRQAARHAAARVDPVGVGDLAAAEKRARASRELVLYPGPGQMHTLAGRLDPEGAAVLAAALDPLSAPLPTTVAGADPRTPARRRADALVELARRALASADLPDSGADRPQLVITMTLDQLHARLDERDRTHPSPSPEAGAGGMTAAVQAPGPGVGGAEMTGGPLRGPLSIAGARRLACDAQVIPMLLGSQGEVLDLGRSARTASRAQRRALTRRDRGCAFPGCTRPPSWCQAHHIRPWSRGGRTDLHNLVLVCGYHHDLIHHDGWTVHMGSDHRPAFSAPPAPPPPEPPPEPP